MKYKKITVCAVIFCREIENLIKLLISPGIPFWNRKYSTNYTESGDNIIKVVTWEISKFYVAEKNTWTNGVNSWTPGQDANSLYCLFGPLGSNQIITLL